MGSLPPRTFLFLNLILFLHVQDEQERLQQYAAEKREERASAGSGRGGASIETRSGGEGAGVSPPGQVCACDVTCCFGV